MAIAYDPDKERRNLAKHGISLRRLEVMVNAIATNSPRHGEDRQILFGVIDGTVHAAVIVRRDTETRVISLRRASRRERKVYSRGTRTR